MKKEIKKLTKVEKEKIENKLLTVFAVALGAVMILMYLTNWLNGSAGFRVAAQTIIYGGLIAFIVMAVLFKIKSNKLAKEDQTERAKKYNNWFIFSIVAAVVSLLAYPDSLLKLVMGEDAFNSFYVNFWGRFTWFGQSVVGSRLTFFMALIAIYVIVVFVYYGIYLHKAHKSSLNKGGKKKSK